MDISVIIPVYNASQYINECIASLLCQTLTSLEIIVVDDKGTDDSISKVQSIINSHPRGNIIKIHSMPQNSGAWAARNAGIEIAQGEYIAFVDADDWCDNNMFQTLYNNAIKHNAQWSYTGALEEHRLGLSKPISQTLIPSGEISTENRKRFAIESKALFWTGIYKRSFLTENNIRFPQSKFSEDSFFVAMVAFLAQNVAVDNTNMYHYRIVQSSVSRRPDQTKAMQKVKVFNKLKAELTERNIYSTYAEQIDYMILKKGYIIPLIIECINNPKDCIKRTLEIKDILETNIPNYKNNTYLKNNKTYNFILNAILKHPKAMSFALRLKYKQDPF